MGEPRHVAVIDIGKTNAKVALVDLDALSEIDLRKTPNRTVADGPYPHHDVERLWEFILDSLAALARAHGVDAISVTTHGATAALVGDGGLVLPVLDYEHDGPDSLRRDYDAVRPDFEETGSPPLPAGLNLGAQLFWQSREFPDAFARVSSILSYPQYWAWRLCGVAANEPTSLGCHTDLWSPAGGGFSTLVGKMGWRKLFAPVRPARDRLGAILPEVAARTGLDQETPVYCGIHDSNASLLPHLLGRTPPFAVVSTGTWVVAMAVGGRRTTLDPARDTLINVDAFGDPVASARFMGGREYELLLAGRGAGWNDADLETVLSGRVMLLPSVQQGSGPFPAGRARWAGGEPDGGALAVAASFYLAMMTATCLELAGAEGDVVVEGSFAANGPYASMLAAATGRPVMPQAGHTTGTSIGAALLAGRPGPGRPQGAAVRCDGDAWRAYARAWMAAAGAA